MTRDPNIDRLRYEASQHRTAARHLRERSRSERDPLQQLFYRSAARERTALAKQADGQAADLRSLARMVAIMRRHDGREQ